MARPSIQYVCEACGTVSSKWTGKCEGCGAWNTLNQETVSPVLKKRGSHGGLTLVPLSEAVSKEEERLQTGWAEFDRVCGGGLVAGSVTLVGGDPGIGKSTLLLQVLASLSATVNVAYISGEEGVNQIRGRARRLGYENATMLLASHGAVGDILKEVRQHRDLRVLVIDSIQTMCVETVEAAAGTVSQIRASAHELTKFAKTTGVAVFLVGHVTKEGMIAGPKLLEHMVDTVLYFEGERGHPFRLLRSVKNRFGPTDEIGVFDMTQEGLLEVPNPSALFMTERSENVTGACVFAGMEGTRPLLVEIQALVSPSFLPSPRRAVVGWDHARLAMILAILEARCGLSYGNKDVYLSVVGGIRITEPAADMAVAACLMSCLFNVPIPHTMVAFGEMSLSGEVRPVQQTDKRLKEAQKLGFSHAVMPKSTRVQEAQGLRLSTYGHIQDLHRWFQSQK